MLYGNVGCYKEWKMLKIVQKIHKIRPRIRRNELKLIVSPVVELGCWWPFQTHTPHFLLSEYWFDPNTQKVKKTWTYIEEKWGC